MTRNKTDGLFEVGGIACIKFTSKTHKDRRALEVMNFCLTQPDPLDPDNPEKSMRPQQVLTESLLALGDKLESGEAVDVDDEESVSEQIQAGFAELRALMADTFTDFAAKLEGMKADGTLTAAQVKDVTGALDANKITETFAKNIGKSFKPGKQK